MANFMKDRCTMICGEDGRQCITANNRQVRCVADMVVNQAYGILSIMDMLKTEKDPQAVDEFLGEVRTISNELINWAKYLQVSHDIRKVVRQERDWQNDSRREARYPFPEEFGEFISLRVDGPMAPVKATILNFSQSGVQFRYRGRPPVDSMIACTLMGNERIGKKVGLVCEVKYYSEETGETLVGAQVVEVSDSTDFNFFMSVLEMMSEAGRLKPRAA